MIRCCLPSELLLTRSWQVRNAFMKLACALVAGCSDVLEDPTTTSLASRDSSLMVERVVHATITEFKFNNDSHASVRASAVEVQPAHAG